MSELTDAKILEKEVIEAIRKFESKTGIAVTDIHRAIIWEFDGATRTQKPTTIGIEISYKTRLG